MTQKLYIRVVSGNLAGRKFSMEEPGDFLVGRSPSCDISLPDNSVSGHHALLTYDGEQWRIQDLRSTNGSELNGVRLGQTPELLAGEGVLRIAGVELQYRVESTRARARTAPAEESRRGPAPPTVMPGTRPPTSAGGRSGGASPNLAGSATARPPQVAPNDVTAWDDAPLSPRPAGTDLDAVEPGDSTLRAPISGYEDSAPRIVSLFSAPATATTPPPARTGEPSLFTPSTPTRAPELPARISSPGVQLNEPPRPERTPPSAFRSSPELEIPLSPTPEWSASSELEIPAASADDPLLEENQQLKQEVSGLSQQLTALRQELAAARQESAARAEGSSQEGALKQENGTLRQENGTLRQEVAANRQENGTLRQEVGTLRQENSALRQEVATLRQESAPLRQENPALRQELEALRQRVAQLQKALAEEQASSAQRGPAGPTARTVLEQSIAFTETFGDHLEALAAALASGTDYDRARTILRNVSLSLGDLRSLLEEGRRVC